MASMFTLRPSVLMGLVIFSMKQTLCAPQVPCYFSFGDSTVDNGNNNNLFSLAKTNFPPYGVDFPDGSPDRFTNGLTIVDFIAKFLGFDDFRPPYATARNQNIIKGVNYASAAAGIRDETGVEMGDRMSFNRQLRNHGRVVKRIATLLGKSIPLSIEQHLSKCLYTVILGSNDYINNYFLPQFFPTSAMYAPDQYAAILIQQYSKQLEVLYKRGARKVALFGLGALGCTPAEKNTAGTNTCVDSINEAAELFNNRLRLLVDDLNARLPNATFIYLNVTSILSGDSTTLGLRLFNRPCCQLSSTGLCIPNSIPCSNRTQYAFYDAYHPTEVVYRLIAERAYESVLPSDAYPMDISHLVHSQ